MPNGRSQYQSNKEWRTLRCPPWYEAASGWISVLCGKRERSCAGWVITLAQGGMPGQGMIVLPPGQAPASPEGQPMANEAHLELIRQGVDVWNAWRTKEPSILPNLHAADLREANLIEADLGGAGLQMANLDNANLNGAASRRTSQARLPADCLQLRQAGDKDFHPRSASLAPWTRSTSPSRSPR